MAETGCRTASVALCLAALLLCFAPTAGTPTPSRGTRSAVKLLEERPHNALRQVADFNRLPSARSMPEGARSSEAGGPGRDAGPLQVALEAIAMGRRFTPLILGAP
jgi:hypothetical protein